MSRFKTVAAVVFTTVLAFTTNAAATPPPDVPSAEEESPLTAEAPPPTETTVVVTDPPQTDPPPTEPPATEPDTGTTVYIEVTEGDPNPVVVEESTTTANPVQVNQDQAVVITATVVADANTGSNVLTDSQPPQGGSGGSGPAEVDSGDATAVGSADANVVTQGAEITLQDQATANVLQVALVINVGVAFANSGYNQVSATPGAQGITAGVVTGDANATGLEIDSVHHPGGTRDRRRRHRRPRQPTGDQPVDGLGYGEFWYKRGRGYRQSVAAVDP